MKIYNKKKFADGCFFLVLGAGPGWGHNLEAGDRWKECGACPHSPGHGADALVRSLSRRLSYQDKVEALDERNIQVELRARSPGRSPCCGAP